MNLSTLSAYFRYAPKTGRLYRSGKWVKGFCKGNAGRLYVTHRGVEYSYSLVCFGIQNGYLPGAVFYRDGNLQNNRAANLYDPNPPDIKEWVGTGMSRVRCGHTGELKGYVGSFYIQGEMHTTPLSETEEIARSLRMLLKAQVEWEQLQKETEQ